jgi:four helix bundle protein
MRDFKKLGVWEKAHLLTIQVYKATTVFPKEEQYGLTSQLRRSSVSIGSNIVAGCGRDGNVEFGRFLQIAMGSLYELEYQLLLARDLNYLDEKVYSALNNSLAEIRKMMVSLIRKLKAKDAH